MDRLGVPVPSGSEDTFELGRLFGDNVPVLRGEPGYVAAGLSKARHKPGADRVDEESCNYNIPVCGASPARGAVSKAPRPVTKARRVTQSPDPLAAAASAEW